MIKIIISFAAGLVVAKFVTKQNVKRFKDAALKSYVTIKDEFSDKEDTKEESI